MLDRDNELEDRKQEAYERGQNWGYTNKSFGYAEQLGYLPNSDEYLAFLDGYEDGCYQYENETAS